MQRAVRFLLPMLLLAGAGCRAAHDRRDLVESDTPASAATVDDDAADSEASAIIDLNAGPDATRAEAPDPEGDAAGTVTGDLDATRALVKAVQSQLVALGFAAGYPDGEIGERTRVALSAFQREQKLPVTGEANVATLSALFRAEPNDPDGEIVPTRGEDAAVRGPKGRPKLSHVRTLGFGAGVGFLVASGLAALAFVTRRR